MRPENSGAAQLGAVALAHLGEHDRAKDWIARALAVDPDDLLLQYNVACVYAQLGEFDLALDMLEKVLPYRSPEQISWFKNDSDLDPIRGHPRYSKLLETIGSERRRAAR